MTAITARWPLRPGDIRSGEMFVRCADGVLLRVPAYGYRGRERPPGRGRKVRKLLRELIAFKQGKKR
jgi:hypothetical protein